MYFSLKLIPNRPTFSKDMTPEERAIMQQHVVYWKDLMKKGKVIVFGPVLDPAAVYGLGIIEVENEDEAKTFIANDPAGTINIYEYHQMMAVVKE